MRILFAGERLSVGGPGRVIENLAVGMARMGHEVGIINMRPEPQVYSVDPRVEIMEIHTAHVDRYRVAPERFFALRRAIEKYRPDRVCAFCTEINNYTLWATLGRRCTVIVSERSDPQIRPVLRSDRVRRDISYTLLGRHLVFQTEDARAYFPERIRRLGAVIENPLNSDSLPLRGRGSGRVKLSPRRAWSRRRICPC